MLKGLYNKKKTEGRNPKQSLTQALPGVVYPPTLPAPKSATKEVVRRATKKGLSQIEDDPSKKRPRSPPGTTSSIPKKARGPSPAAPAATGAGSSRGPTCFTGNLSGDEALELIENLGVPGDKRRLDKLPEELTAKMSALAPRMRMNFNDGTLLDDYNKLGERNKKLHQKIEKLKEQAGCQVDAATKKMHEAVEKSEVMARELEGKTRELEELKAEMSAKISAARDEGYLSGRQGFLQSEYGLSVVERVRRATEKTAIRSLAFANAVLGVVPFYGEYFLGIEKQMLEVPEALDTFDMDKAMDAAPDHPSMEMSADDLGVTRLASSEFLKLALSRPLSEWVIPEVNPPEPEDSFEDVAEADRMLPEGGDVERPLHVDDIPQGQGGSPLEGLDDPALQHMHDNPERVLSHTEDANTSSPTVSQTIHPINI